MPEPFETGQLDPLRDFTPGDSSAVDITAALRTGKRHVQVRRAAGTAVCVLAIVGLLSGLVTTWERLGPVATSARLRPSARR